MDCLAKMDCLANGPREELCHGSFRMWHHPNTRVTSTIDADDGWTVVHDGCATWELEDGT